MTLNASRVQILNDHNQYRARHRAQPLRLDDTLNRSAQAYAEQLSRQDAGIPHSGCQYGENLYSCWGMSPMSASRVWYDEVSLYNYNGGGYSPSTGHFTQLVWRSTSCLGVGISQSSSGRHYVVAHYYTPGNASGQFAHNVLPPQGNGAATNTSHQSVKQNQSQSVPFDNQFLQAHQNFMAQLQSMPGSSATFECGSSPTFGIPNLPNGSVDFMQLPDIQLTMPHFAMSEFHMRFM